MRFFIGLILILGLGGNLEAQKMEVYYGILAGKPLYVVLDQDQLGKTKGYAINTNEKKRFELEVAYNFLGHFWTIHCADPRSNFRFLTMRLAPNVFGKLEGNYYGEGIHGFFELRLQTQINPPVEQTVGFVNTLYPVLQESLGLPSYREGLPFIQDLNTAAFYLDQGADAYFPSGLLLGEREVLEFQNVKVRFKDWTVSTLDYEAALGFEFQLITYFPSMIVLAIVHEKRRDLNADSTLEESFHLFLFEQQNDKSWRNTTMQRIVGKEDFVARMQERAPEAKFEMGADHFSIHTEGDGVKMHLSTPRIMLHLPTVHQTSGKKSLTWQWHNEGLIFK